jgi:AraC-like DNA-binding protein
MLFFFPNILYGLPRLDYELSSAVVLPGFSEPSFAKTKGSKDFEMSDSKLELISKKVNSYIIDKPYINPSFTVSLMSSQTGIPAHHISYYFNVYLKVDFTTWKNNLRIDYAIELINNGLADKLTLDAILRKVGFLSRSTFISAFKKRTGKTPSDYLSLE